MTDSTKNNHIIRILALDGGGAKGVYTLGVLKEVEAVVNEPLHATFSLIYGTSTGAIIAALIGLGKKVEEVLELYLKYVPAVMKPLGKKRKSKALRILIKECFGNKRFDEFRTDVGIVATNWALEKPMIFKTDIGMAHGLRATFQPGFGCSIGEAVNASCAAYPFFERPMVKTANQGTVELADGGYCANNPSLFAIADALVAMKAERDNIRLLSVGVGNYPEPKYPVHKRLARRLESVRLLQKTMSVNTCSMDQLRRVLFPDIQIVRVNDTFEKPELSTDFLEHNPNKLNLLYQQGRESFAKMEFEVTQLLK